MNEPFDVPISQPQAHFWTLLGSFAMPLLLVPAGMLVAAEMLRRRT